MQLGAHADDGLSHAPTGTRKVLALSELVVASPDGYAGPYTWHSRRQGSREIRGVSSMAELQSSKLRTTGSIPSHRSNLTCGSRRVYLWWAAGQVSAVPTVRHLKT